MALGCGLTAFAAEPSMVDAEWTDANTAEAGLVEIPVVFETAGTADAVSPFRLDSQIDFTDGARGDYIPDCGFTPTFQFWATGGSWNTQVYFNVKTSGGVNYGPFGPVNANGSNYATKSFVVAVPGGNWHFTAYTNDGSSGITFHVRQIG